MSRLKTQTVAIVAALFLAGCLPEDDKTQNEQGTSLRAVKTLVAQARPAIQTRRFPSVLEPLQLVPLSFEVGGRVAEVDLRVGQSVSAGEVLATIEPLDLDLRLSQAEAALQGASVAAQNAQAEANRQTTLFERGVTTGAARDNASAQSEQAQANLIQAQRNVDLLRKNRANASLTAPFDAIINGVDIQDFTMVQQGQPVVTLYQEGTLQASILVSYDVVLGLDIGDEVEIAPTDGNLLPLKAKVTEIGRRAPAVSSFPVTVKLQNVDEQLRSGMAVEVRLETMEAETAGLIPLPLSAIDTNTSGPFVGAPPFSATIFVFVPNGAGQGRLEQRDVLVATAAEGEVFVTRGLENGERVVTAGVPFLRSDQLVTLYDIDGQGN